MKKNRLWIPAFVVVSIIIWVIGLFMGNGDPIDIYGDPAVQNAHMPAFITYNLVHYGAPVISALVVAFVVGIAWLTMGKKPALSMIAFALFIAFIYEDMGIRTGWVFGPYYHTTLEGVKIGTVPLVVVCLWTFVIYAAWTMINLFLDGTPVQSNFSVSRNIFGAVTGAMVLTTFDLGADPFFVSNGWWVWFKGGVYAGVPIHNYVGWMALGIVTLLVHSFDLKQHEVLDLTIAPKWKQILTVVPILPYGLFWVLFMIANPEGYIGLIVFFVMGIPFVLSLKRWFDWYKSVRA